MSVYFDASILVSMFARDRYTPHIFPWIGQLTEPVLVSGWAVAEFTSALGVRRRMGSLERAEREDIELALDQWLAGGVDRTEPTATDIRVARQVMREERAPLKAPDALHLVMALRSRSILATTDRRLRRAAEAFGIATDAP